MADTINGTLPWDFRALDLGSTIALAQEWGALFWYHPVVFALRRMFIVVGPNETSFETLEDSPNYVQEAFPYFILFILLEFAILLYQGHTIRFDDSMSSLIAGVFSFLPNILLRPIELATYIWVYEHYRLIALPWDSPVTWFLALLGVDFCYYWIHRFAHEVNFMWAAHQVHHSSEEYNLTTGLRQSVLQNYSSWMFYLPLALGVPPSVFIIHKQFNLLYQFWIHTELITDLGPLEYVLNTASHHRVHHGANRYCIDKNYAGVFIIWDRMFNTFEKEGEKPVYGLVLQDDASWDTLNTQFSHWQAILQAAWEMEGFGNKLSVFWKGPGWSPGNPRCGVLEDIPEKPVRANPRGKYNAHIPLMLHLYAYVHFSVCLVFYVLLAATPQEEYWLKLGGTLFLIWTLTDIGYIYERKWYMGHVELARCLAYIAIDLYLSPADPLMYVPRSIYLLSISIWLVNFVQLPGDQKIKAQ